MKQIISIIQIATALLIIILTLVQDRGEGLSSTFGGEGGGFQQGRRGIEKIMHWTTIAGLIVFAATSVANLFIR
jgi:protein translocase SecG subunit